MKKRERSPVASIARFYNCPGALTPFVREPPISTLLKKKMVFDSTTLTPGPDVKGNWEQPLGFI